MTHPRERIAHLDVADGDLLPDTLVPRVHLPALGWHRRFVERNIAPMDEIEEDGRSQPAREADQEVARRLERSAPRAVWLRVHRRLEGTAELVRDQGQETGPVCAYRQGARSVMLDELQP